MFPLKILRNLLFPSVSTTLFEPNSRIFNFGRICSNLAHCVHPNKVPFLEAFHNVILHNTKTRLFSQLYVLWRVTLMFHHLTQPLSLLKKSETKNNYLSGAGTITILTADVTFSAHSAQPSVDCFNVIRTPLLLIIAVNLIFYSVHDPSFITWNVC